MSKLERGGIMSKQERPGGIQPDQGYICKVSYHKSDDSLVLESIKYPLCLFYIFTSKTSWFNEEKSFARIVTKLKLESVKKKLISTYFYKFLSITSWFIVEMSPSSKDKSVEKILEFKTRYFSTSMVRINKTRFYLHISTFSKVS